jgi:tetratricopeptide (TPR) repeat protein
MKKENKGDPSVSPAKLSGKKTWLFKAIAIAVPIIILALFELSLRLFHYGYNMDLFMTYPANPDYMIMNPDASKKFFVNPAFAASGNSELFKKIKDKNTVRIFVLGESTTIGFPYFHNGSFHRWLLYRLMREYPDRHFEIINVSLTAVNSYTVLDFSKEIVHYEPDAVLIYSGHNEYYGALGVSSTNKTGSSRLITQFILYLRPLRITQLLTALYLKIASFGNNRIRGSGETLMQLMVADQEIPFQSKLFYKGVDQFRVNMDATLKIFSDQHIPVFLGNLVSNEKDLKPFTSNEPESNRLPDFTSNYKLGIIAFERKDLVSANRYFTTADKIYDKHAGCKYYLASVAYAQQNFRKAKENFDLAGELDELRFRAPLQMNEIIMELCRKYHGVHLVDIKHAFEIRSENNIIGSSLMLEHVHPNLYGYAIISKVFYETMKTSGFLSWEPVTGIPFDSLLVWMPITTVDSLIAAIRITNLEKNWPFSTASTIQPPGAFYQKSEEERLADNIVYKKMNWTAAMEELFTYYVGEQNYVRAGKVMEGLVLEHPTEESFCEKAGNVFGEMREYDMAVFYFRKSFDLSPSFALARMLFVLYLKLDRPVEALTFLDYAIRNNEPGLNLVPIKSRTLDIVALEKQFVKDSVNISIPNQIAKNYMSMGNAETARKYLDIVLRKDHKNKEALLMLNQVLQSKK